MTSSPDLTAWLRAWTYRRQSPDGSTAVEIVVESAGGERWLPADSDVDVTYSVVRGPNRH